MKKFKRLCMSLIIMMLAVAMVVSTMSFTAFAAPGIGAAKLTQLTKHEFNIQSKVEFGKTFSVPDSTGDATVTVTAPNGTVVQPTGGKVTANQVGNYIVKYAVKGPSEVGGEADKDYSYDFNVNCYVAKSYSISVANGGAGVPTYAKTGEKIELPAASLVYTDEDGNIVSETATVKVNTSAEDSANLTANDKGEYEFTPASAGNVYVTYYAELGETGSAHVYTKNFVIKVQDGFADSQRPTLSVVNVSTNASLNRKVTLPTATASDDFDANVKVEISVTDPSGTAVKEVDVNDDGFAVVKKDAKDVAFDNDKVMSFYPTSEGRYAVTYMAVDDSGNSSAVHNYSIEVSDTTAPVFKSIEDWKIPANWGTTVNDNSAPIYFPTPVVVDNAGTEENITVAFKITDSENNTVVNISNILSEDSKYTGTNTTYTKDFAISDGFDFANVATENKTGDFTVEYAARDSKGNRSTRTFKINVVDNFEDKETPSDCTIVDAPEYFAVTDDVETFVLPAYTAADKGDSRPHVEYTLESAKDTENKLTDLEGGEALEVVRDDDGRATGLKKSDEDTVLAIEGGYDLTLTLKVSDLAGNESATTSEVIKVFTPQMGNEITLDPSSLSLNGDFKTKEEANLGGFTITTADDYRKFTGYEFSITAPDGGLVPEVSSEYFYNTEAHAIVVRNITFTPGSEGVYMLTVRAFDLAGNNDIRMGLFNVESGEDDTVTTTAASLLRTGNINTAYTFKNSSFTIQGSKDDTYFTTYRIIGSAHSVMGNEFTALTASSYRFYEGYVQYAGGIVDEKMTEKETYTVNFADDATAAIDVQGVVPSYVAVNAKVELPKIVAYSKNGNGTVEVAVKRNSGGTVKVTLDEEKGQYTFTPDKDGTYTITITGTVNGSSTSTDYTLNVGDVTGPKFTVVTPTTDRATVGRTFEFSEVTLSADSDDAIGDCTFTKRLIDPSGDTVSEATVTGKGKTYADRKMNNNTTVTLTKSGTYQVVYEVTDAVGNTTTVKYSITVSAKTGRSAVSIAAISTVLIVVGVVLIAAVILYFVLFRRRKAKN